MSTLITRPEDLPPDASIEARLDTKVLQGGLVYHHLLSLPYKMADPLPGTTLRVRPEPVYADVSGWALHNFILPCVAQNQLEGGTEQAPVVDISWVPIARHGLERLARARKIAGGELTSFTFSVADRPIIKRAQERAYTDMLRELTYLNGDKVVYPAGPEFIEQVAYGQIVVRGYARAAKRYKRTYGIPIYGIPDVVRLTSTDPR
jgi:hypothetical protein